MIINSCLTCNSRIKKSSVICDECLNLLDKALINNCYVTCQTCGFPLLNEVYHCPECERRNGLYIFSLYDYKNYFARQILNDYKFNFKKQYSLLYAKILQPYVNDYDYIVPVPSSKTSFKKRGWDQMYEIAIHLKNVKLIPLISNNDNYVNINQQKELNREERISNSIDKYKLNNYEIDKNSKILIIDDVVTTGSTLINCYKLLKDAGYTNIKAFSFYAEL